jgi:UDP-N-acetylglucosamine acyltransferase
VSLIHPTAIVEPGAQLGARVQIGPYSYIGPHVTLGDGVEVFSHVVITGRTTLGAHTTVYPFASLGHAPQDLKYQGEPSTLEIGSHNKIREYVTMQPGTAADQMKTFVGDHGLFMAGSHIAHDCVVGNHVIMANNATLGGHVTVGDYVVIGGLAAVHQFVRIGPYAMIGGTAGVAEDVIPYGSVEAKRAYLGGLNLVGLTRRKVPKAEIHALREAFRLLFVEGSGAMVERLQTLSPVLKAVGAVQEMIHFIEADASRPLCRSRLAKSQR